MPLTIELPDTLLALVKMSREEFAREGRFLLLAKLYEMGAISSGKAAEMCGMSRVKFLLSLSRIGVPMIDLSDDELAREVEFGRG